jgi:hypothetical protein
MPAVQTINIVQRIVEVLQDETPLISILCARPGDGWAFCAVHSSVVGTSDREEKDKTIVAIKLQLSD